MESLPDNWLSLVGSLAIVVGVAWLSNWMTTRVFRGVIRRVAKRTKSTWDDRIIERKVFARIANVVPALVILYGVGPALGVTPADVAQATGPDALADPDALMIGWMLTRRVAAAFIVLTVAMAFSNFLDAVNDIYNETYEQSAARPIKGYLQVISLVVYIGAGIVVVATLADRSPLVFLSGLGALTAVLLLVFRDTILSLVASLQIMSNDMIRIGDWVEMPQANADGDVIDIALHTVKIQNWDKTITTVPTHKFISESFRNWRGMSESGGRRIKRALHIDMGSVRFLTDEETETLSRYELLKEYMSGKLEEIGRHNAGKRDDPHTIPEVRRLTNLGTFRAYVVNYLKTHPKTHQEMTLLVRQLPTGPKGVPIEIYCFSNDTVWANYEGFQADVFDHLIAILPEFGLEAFQEPSGRDLEKLARASG